MQVAKGAERVDFVATDTSHATMALATASDSGGDGGVRATTEQKDKKANAVADSGLGETSTEDPSKSIACDPQMWTLRSLADSKARPIYMLDPKTVGGRPVEGWSLAKRLEDHRWTGFNIRQGLFQYLKKQNVLRFTGSGLAFDIDCTCKVYEPRIVLCLPLLLWVGLLAH